MKHHYTLSYALLMSIFIPISPLFPFFFFIIEMISLAKIELSSIRLPDMKEN